MKTLLLKNANVILPDCRSAYGSVLIENGRITEISSNNKEFKADEVIDVANASLFPGFIDMHIHGAVGVDTNEADADGLHKVARFLAKNGATAWLPTLVPDSEENYRGAIEA